jgi:hypothetical protein
MALLSVYASVSVHLHNFHKLFRHWRHMMLMTSPFCLWIPPVFVESFITSLCCLRVLLLNFFVFCEVRVCQEESRRWILPRHSCYFLPFTFKLFLSRIFSKYAHSLCDHGNVLKIWRALMFSLPLNINKCVWMPHLCFHVLPPNAWTGKRILFVFGVQEFMHHRSLLGE